MFKKLKTLDPQTKSMLAAAAVITAINATAILLVKVLEQNEKPEN